MNDAESLVQKAHHCFAEGRWVEAAIFFDKAIGENPHDSALIYNLGVTLGKMDRVEDALVCYKRAIELNPAFAYAYVNFAICLNELGLIAQARQGFALAHSLTPDDPIPVLNEGIAALALGDYAAGWAGFAARWRLPAYAKFERHFDQPAWQGEALNSRTIFLYAEQGFGDVIQMARFIPVLAAQGARVVVETPPALTRLMQSVFGVAEVICKGDVFAAFDTYAAMMDVPRFIQTPVETIPAEVPYVTAPADDIRAMNKKIRPERVRKIGLAWAGRASHENDAQRSLALAQLEPLWQNQTIDWISLQRVVPERDMAVLSRSGIQDWGQGFVDFAATAAAIENLDLVITVDSAVAHLAGALGKPVWILLPYYADWRWLIGRDDSPWYPSARLWRQRKRRDWGEVIARIAAQLEL